MARLNWGVVAERFFETGVDHGVLYTGDGIGVPWNGLTSVNETPIGGDPKPAYIDGRKFRNIASSEEFEATIEAFAAPKEFGPCDGSRSIQNGLIATQQPRQAFNFSYRTLIGNPIAGAEFGYKIHLVYNALAGPAQRTNGSIKDSTEASRLSWAITTLPPSLSNYKATSHFVIDSRETPRGLLAAVEDILYGTEINSARMPLVSELVTMFQSEGPVTRRNLLPNPAFRETSSSVEVRRNLVSNPSYKFGGVAGAVIRRNKIVDPRLVNGSGWAGVTATGVAGAATTSTSDPYGPNVTAVAGERWTVSVELTAPAGAALTGNISVGSTTGESFGANALGSTAFNIPAGTTKRVSDTFVIPAGANGFRLFMYGLSTVSGIVIDKALAEKSYFALPYFDGASAAADGLTFAWAGAVNNSESIASGLGTPTISFRGYLRSSWLITGGASDGTNTTLCYIGQNSSTIILSSQDAPAAVQNDTVFGRFRVRGRNLSAPLLLRPQLFAYTSASVGLGRIVQAADVTVPVDGSWVDVIIPPTLISNATAGLARLYVTLVTNAAVSGILEVSNQMVSKSLAVLPWFDGRTPTDDGLVYSFTGIADASPSIATGQKPTNWTALNSAIIWQGEDGESMRIMSSGIGSDGAHYVVPGVTGGSVMSASAMVETDSGDVPAGTLSFVATNPTTVYSQPYADGERTELNGKVIIDPLTSLTTCFYTTGPAGTMYTVRDVLVEQAPAVGPYFDGSSVDSDKYFYSWEGAVNASASRINTWN
jgi:hypothetical protein